MRSDLNRFVALAELYKTHALQARVVDGRGLQVVHNADLRLPARGLFSDLYHLGLRLVSHGKV